MTDFAAVKRALEEVRGLSTAAREAWLSDLAASDAELHAEVVSLLAHEHAELPAIGVDASDTGGSIESFDSAFPLPYVIDDGPERTYTLVEVLGQGGFGDVFLAQLQDQGVERLVAIKVLRTKLDGADRAAQRLYDEARLLGTLRHPGIVTFLGLVEIDGRPGLVTEYVEGDDLAGCITGPHPLEERAVLEVIEQVADALATAWEQVEVVHRDVKPHNVRIGVHGEVKLLDFGIARSIGLARAVRTQSQHLIGTLRYLAPERLEAGATAGPAADVFSLGAVLYEALVREPLFLDVDLLSLVQLAARPDAFVTHVSGRLERVSNPEVRALLAQILDIDPAARPTASMVSERCDELAHALPRTGSLRRWRRTHRWPTAPRVPGSVSPRRRRRRQRARVGGAALLAVAGVLVALSLRAPETGLPEDAQRPEPVVSVGGPVEVPWVGPPRIQPDRPAPSAPGDPIPAEPAPTSPVRPRPEPAEAPPELARASVATIEASAPPDVVDGPAEVEGPVEEPPEVADEPAAPTRPVELWSVPPGAEVVGPDGSVLGVTPWASSMPVGNHTMTLRTEGAERTVEVRLGWLDAGTRYTWHVRDARVSTTSLP